MADNPLYLSASAGTDSGAGTGIVDGSGLGTGDLRRKYDFSDRFTELAIAQTPFFRLVSKLGKSPVDDPQFKYTEKRQSWMKRYAYVVGYIQANDAPVVTDATLQDKADNDPVAGGADKVHLILACDYLNAGNKQSIIGQTGIKAGAAGTRPQFILPKQIIKVNATDSSNYLKAKDYWLFSVDSVVDSSVDTDLGGADENVTAICTCVRVPSSSYGEMSSYPDANGPGAPLASTAPSATKGLEDVEQMRSYIVGSAYEEGSDLNNKTWKDQPYSTSYGQTQIFRSEFGMTNTARATVLKYEGNEWARVWRDKLIEHKWDIEQASLFSSQGSTGSGDSTVYYTQGAVDFVLQSGNLFALDHAVKSSDSFLDDMSKFLDPRYNNANATLFFCDTKTYNWLHKLSGYFANNVANMQPGGYDGEANTAAMPSGSASASLGSADFAANGRGKILGIDFTRISTVYGDMKVVRNIHLDGSGIKMLALNMGYVKYRPLVGNGVSRDTSVYVGVKTLENSGVDRRIDMILTEAGFEWRMPEAHAIWK